MTARADLAASLSVVADDLEGRGYPYVGVLRAAARELAAGPDAAADGGDCRRCGGEVVQPATGRPRIYCTDCSPRKSPKKCSMAA